MKIRYSCKEAAPLGCTFILSLLLAFGFSRAPTATAQEARQGLVASVPGFHVNGRFLLDANGNNFIMSGINHPHNWYAEQTGSFADIKAKGANTVRVVLSLGHWWPKNNASDVANVIDLCKTNKLICVLEVHDTTGYGEIDAASLAEAVDYWKEIKSVLDGQEAYAIINIGNEPYGNLNASGWVTDTKNAIQEMREAGFQHMLMVDAPNWGQDWEAIMRNNAADIFASDPLSNTVFSIHMYGVYDTQAKVQAYISAFVNAGLPLVVGEFGAQHTDGDPEEDAILSITRSYGIGYLGWSWSGNSPGGEYLDMVTDFDPNQETWWGNRIIHGDNGIMETACQASVYAGGNCKIQFEGNVGPAQAMLSFTDGTPKTISSQADGKYGFQVSYGWSGTVTPSHPCYTFDPVDRTYTNVATNQTNQDYTASLIPGTVCVLTIVPANANPTRAESVDFTVTFTGAVQGVDVDDFSAIGLGVTGAAVTNVSGTGAVYTVSVDTGAGDGLLRLEVPNSATITDLSAHALSGVPFTSGEPYTVMKSGRFLGADFNGDGQTDVAVFRPSNSTWYIQGVGSFVYGTVGDIPVPADYNGDGKDEIAVFRPSNSTWYIYGVGSFVYGTVGDIPVVADYNGDGKDDIAVFRPSNSTWYILGVGPRVYGTVGDIPVVADYDGDGKDDIAVFRPSNSTWYLYGIGPRVYGTVGDIPVVADYDGDGKADIAVFRPTNSTWYLYGIGPRVYGTVGDIPVIGDYNGDGKADIAVFRPSNSTWYLYGVGPRVYGTVGDIPV